MRRRGGCLGISLCRLVSTRIPARLRCIWGRWLAVVASTTRKGGRRKKSKTTTAADAVSHIKAQTRGARRTSVSDANLVFKETNVSQLKGKKMRNICTRVYDVKNTVFSDQTGQLPTRSQRGNKYIMVMVEIDSYAILVEPLKSRKDPELTRAYQAMM